MKPGKDPHAAPEPPVGHAWSSASGMNEVNEAMTQKCHVLYSATQFKYQIFFFQSGGTDKAS